MFKCITAIIEMLLYTKVALFQYECPARRRQVYHTLVPNFIKLPIYIHIYVYMIYTFCILWNLISWYPKISDGYWNISISLNLVESDVVAKSLRVVDSHTESLNLGWVKPMIYKIDTCHLYDAITRIRQGEWDIRAMVPAVQSSSGTA